MKAHAALAAAAGTLLASPASACATLEYPYFLLLDRPPAAIPRGAVVLKVVDPRPDIGFGVTAKLVTGTQGFARGSSIRLKGIWSNSCVGPGRVDRPAYVVAFPNRRLETGQIPALAYENVWWAGLARMLGWNVWWPGALMAPQP